MTYAVTANCKTPEEAKAFLAWCKTQGFWEASRRGTQVHFSRCSSAVSLPARRRAAEARLEAFRATLTGEVK